MYSTLEATTLPKKPHKAAFSFLTHDLLFRHSQPQTSKCHLCYKPEQVYTRDLTGVYKFRFTDWNT